jgi:hypothetical protein
MLLAIRNAALISILWATEGLAWPQEQPPPPAAAPDAPPAFDAGQYEPVCSTEKVNGDCFFNIDRNYPITLPTFQMKRGAHVSIYVFHPYVFEALTLDAGTATAFESSDQVSALVTAAGPVGKGAVLGILDSEALSTALLNPNFANTAKLMDSQIGGIQNRSPQDDLARRIVNELTMIGITGPAEGVRLEINFGEKPSLIKPAARFSGAWGNAILTMSLPRSRPTCTSKMLFP